MLDECIPDTVKLKEEKWFLVWQETKKDEYWEDVTYDYKLNKNHDSFYVKTNFMMSSETVNISKIWENYLKSIDNAWCGGSNIDQKVYDKNWKEIENFQLSDIKKEIYIWNVKFIQTLTWTWGFWQPLESYNKYETYKDDKGEYKIYKNEDEFIKFATNKALKEDKKLYWSYIVQFKNHPWINIMFNSIWYDSNSIRVVYLWTDKDYLSKNIKENWDFTDLDVTNKIISYYSWDEVSYWIFDKDGNRILKVDNTKLPLFSMKKLDENGNYLVYLKDNYELQSFAEMCKPVVYYYSKNKEENSLKLDLKKWDYFTKLIPELSEKSTWDFEANNSKIEVNNKSYDYLYYSLVTTWYEHNKNWWIVRWNDIVNFFEDKLEKINFSKKEKSDFIDFWKKEYKNDKYYFVSFKYKEDLDKIVPLNFSNKVDNEFRVLLDSYELENLSKDKEKFLYSSKDKNKFDKYLIKRFERGNTSNEVFEWWGVLRKENNIIIK
jgi:hypothetical protein